LTEIGTKTFSACTLEEHAQDSSQLGCEYTSLTTSLGKNIVRAW